jgi:hypothetical protein
MLVDKLNGYISNKTTPVQKVGIAGFTAMARVRDVMELRSRVPMSVVEDGSSIGDHVINDPISVTIEGVVGDVYIAGSPLATAFREVAPIGKVLNYLLYQTRAQVQKIAGYASQALDLARRVDDIAKTGRDILDFGNKSTNPQRQFIETIRALHDAKSLIPIDTPFERLEQMRIVMATFSQTAESSEVSFKITAQQVRTATVELKKLEPLKSTPVGNPSDDAQEQLAPPAQSKEVALPSQAESNLLRDMLQARGVV